MNEMIDMCEYTDKVLDYLEYLNYPDYIQEYEPEAPVRAISHMAALCYISGVSFRFCALTIFGMTWTYQITKVSSSTIN